ncbi:MAG: hypothetical protein M3R59_10805, partial [Verrucomicrobiota bacterium]|nr:hypothetical protein [Verrucomicrobiota bacterium]
MPRAAAFENVAAQIKSGAAAYSVYALARLFLEKPERYDVRVTAKNDGVLLRAGENGPISTHRPSLESGAFRS